MTVVGDQYQTFECTSKRCVYRELKFAELDQRVFSVGATDDTAGHQVYTLNCPRCGNVLHTLSCIQGTPTLEPFTPPPPKKPKPS